MSGVGGDQQIPSVPTSQVCVGACVIASIEGPVTTSGRRSDKMASIRGSPASCLPELTLVRVLAHKEMNCMKGNEYVLVSLLRVEQSPGLPSLLWL